MNLLQHEEMGMLSSGPSLPNHAPTQLLLDSERAAQTTRPSQEPWHRASNLLSRYPPISSCVYRFHQGVLTSQSLAIACPGKDMVQAHNVHSFAHMQCGDNRRAGHRTRKGLLEQIQPTHFRDDGYSGQGADATLV